MAREHDDSADGDDCAALGVRAGVLLALQQRERGVLHILLADGGDFTGLNTYNSLVAFFFEGQSNGHWVDHCDGYSCSSFSPGYPDLRRQQKYIRFTPSAPAAAPPLVGQDGNLFKGIFARHLA